MTNVAIPDDCCGKPLSKALLAGTLDSGECWTCPKCGMDWKPRAVPGDVRLWEPQPIIAVWRGPAAQPYWWGGTLLNFVLFGILGWAVFGAAIK